MLQNFADIHRARETGLSLEVGMDILGSFLL